MMEMKALLGLWTAAVDVYAASLTGLGYYPVPGAVFWRHEQSA